MTGQTLRMRDGRSLEVWEYGDAAGRPAIFFHGLIGSHLQASYIADQAREAGLRVIAPNRPGVGASDFVVKRSPLESLADVEDLAEALGLERFHAIGISGGAPYALACLHGLTRRVDGVTLISGMGPAQLPGALQGMHRARRVALEVGARYPKLARTQFQQWADTFRSNPRRLLDRLIATWSRPDRALFQKAEVYDLFLRDMHAVFDQDRAAEGLAQELSLYRNFGFNLRALPADRRVTLWQGLDDAIVPPAMSWEMSQRLPLCEAHFVPGGHFVALEIAGRIIDRLTG